MKKDKKISFPEFCFFLIITDPNDFMRRTCDLYRAGNDLEYLFALA